MTGTLHIYVAFDWGDEINLDRAQKLVPPASYQELLRRRRTPSSFTYRPAPLRLGLGPVPITLPEIGAVQASAALTLFDFGAVSLWLRAPFAMASRRDSFGSPAAWPIRRRSPAAARRCSSRFTSRSCRQSRTLSGDDDLSEEYFVFQFASEFLPQAADQDWLAGMVHLESGPA